MKAADVSKLTYTHVQGGQFRWITVSTIMLALGTILHLVSPSVAGVTPNWTIATYCVAIQLTRPTLRQALGIGLVAAMVNVLTSKSPLPYANLVSEPIGALTCALLVMLLHKTFVGKMKVLPVITGLIATIMSGGAFITSMYVVLGMPTPVYVGVLWPFVLMVALCNAVATPLLYFPAQKLFNRRGEAPKKEDLPVEEIDHSHLHLVPQQEGKISVENFSYYYTNAEKPAVKDANLVVHEGDFLVVTGPAGCGKSTLCLAMVGAVPKFYGGTMHGMVFVNGKGTTQMEIADLANEIGVVLADYDTQLVTMTVFEEVAFAMENRGYNREEILARSAEVFRQVGLEGLEDREIHSLSGGQRQRLAIASVLATNPSILVLDEPTSSLDPEGTEELYKLVGSLNKEYGITVVVIDHDLHALLPYANRMVLMKEGEIKIDGTVEETLRYMYQTNTYVDALPSIFAAYMKLEEKGVTFPVPWLSAEDAAEGLR